MSIIITNKGKNAQRLERTMIPKENYLQNYIYNNPESLPLNEINEDMKLLILSREFPTSSGSIDALGFDQEGNIYIIETKLYKNPDKRTVVAQVLDYGASLWRTYGDSREFLQKLDEFTTKEFGKSLPNKIKDTFSLSEPEVLFLIENVTANLDNGAFRFVVLMDQLDPRLKDLITFVNQNSRFDIFGVELEFYRFNDYELVIPKLYGAEAKKDVGVTQKHRRSWNEASFFEDASQRMSKNDIDKLKQLYAFSIENADNITWGTGTNIASFNPKFYHICPRSLYTVYSDGRLRFNFMWLEDSDFVKKVVETIVQKLQQIEGIKLPLNFKEQFVILPLDTWSPRLHEIIIALTEGISIH